MGHENSAENNKTVSSGSKKVKRKVRSWNKQDFSTISYNISCRARTFGINQRENN